MTTRRNFLTLLGVGAASTLAGCTVRAVSSGLAGPPDVLILDTTAGVAVLRGPHLQTYGPAALTPDLSGLYAVRAAGADTDLLAIATASGAITAAGRLPGDWVPAVAAADGRTVTLTPPGAAGPYPTGTGRTSLLVAGDGEPVRLDLAGTYVPDAFATENTSLFVLDWLPASAPDHYRVREITLATGTLTALYTRDKQPIRPEDEEQMRGERRAAVYGPGQEVLYTLYTNQSRTSDGPDGWDAAFVHTLHLSQHWAYCVDLPAPFGFGPNAGHAVAIHDDGRRLFVLDTTNAHIAVIDTEALAVVRTAELPAGAGSAYAVATAARLFLAAGPVVHGLDLSNLTARISWDLPGPARGLARSADGTRVYIGLADAVAWHDAGTGKALGTAAVPGLTGIRAAL